MAADNSDERELPRGRHLVRWGRAHISSFASASPWSVGSDAVVLPVGADPKRPSGRWFDAFAAAAGDRLAERIRDAFAAIEEDAPRVRVLEVDLPGARPPILGLRVIAVRIDLRTAAAADVEDAARQAVIRADNLGFSTLAMPIFCDPDFARASAVVDAMMRIESLPPPISLRSVVLVAERIAAFVDAGGRPVRPQAFANDDVSGADLLETATECGAVAEMLMLRELEPPLVVGVLGGWGSGKSFALRLIAERMRQLRCLPVEAEMAWPSDRDAGFAYVGHVYTVHFDAWTFAKADLWASLMQTIFTELERQLTLEQQLAAALCPPPADGDEPSVVDEQRRQQIRKGGPLWGVLSEMEPTGRREYLSLLSAKELATFETLATEGPGPLWAELRKRTEAQRVRLEQQSRDLDRLKLQAQQRRAELERKAAEEEAWLAYGSLLRARAGTLYERIREIIRAKISPDGTVDPAFTIGERLRAIPQLILGRPLEFAIVVGVVLAIGGALWWVASTELVRGIVATVTAIVSLVGVYVHAGKALVGELLEHYAEFQKVVDRVTATHSEAKAVRRQEIIEGDDDLRELESRVAEVEATVRKAKGELAFGAFASLHEFVRARVLGDPYDARLGPLQGVQGDLRELSRTITGRLELDMHRVRQLFPRGPARVALFIDDLDRCPPARVVEVLEATQLLLKTELFVVVLALDARYVSRALERVYDGVLSRHGAPSGLDYIEKIIQIPFRVPSVDARRFSRYLRGQVAIAESDAAIPQPIDPGREPSRPPRDGRALRDAAVRPPTDPDQRLQWQQLPTTLMRLTPDEVVLLETCAGGLNLSPRSAKRLINVFKLIKIIWHRQVDRTPRDDENHRAVVGLLALACAWPTVMREVFAFLDTPELHRPSVHLSDVVGALRRTVERTAYQERLWSRAEAASRRILPSGLRLEELDRSAFALVQTFSFVADVGFDPSDAGDAGYFHPEALPPPEERVRDQRPSRRSPLVEW